MSLAKHMVSTWTWPPVAFMWLMTAPAFPQRKNNRRGRCRGFFFFYQWTLLLECSHCCRFLHACVINVSSSSGTVHHIFVFIHESRFHVSENVLIWSSGRHSHIEVLKISLPAYVLDQDMSEHLDWAYGCCCDCPLLLADEWGRTSIRMGENGRQTFPVDTPCPHPLLRGFKQRPWWILVVLYFCFGTWLIPVILLFF